MAPAHWSDEKKSEALVQEIVAEASKAAELWESYATPFLEPLTADLLEKAISGRSDVGWVRVGGYDGAARGRFVFTHPDILDATGSEAIKADHAVLLCITSNNLRTADPLPNILQRIGVGLAQIGDIILADENDCTAYIVCAPDVAKQAVRLLPKDLSGVTTVEELLSGDSDISGIVPEGTLQEMTIERLDKRASKKK